MIDRIYVACCATDVWLARICVASIRYWYPEVPVCLLKDPGRGEFDTSEIERYWQVTTHDSGPCYRGLGFTKLELLFQEKPERLLVLDSDIAMVGPLLDVLTNEEQFVISSDEVANPRTDPIMQVYFDVDRVQAYDPQYRFPGWVFNAGQFVISSNVLKREDFAPAAEWSAPPKWINKELFRQDDQGFLNYLLVAKAQRGEITLGRALLYHDARSEEAAALRFAPPERNNPFLLHWAGYKKPGAGQMARGDILTFFEKLYYSRVPGGWWKRLAREAERRVRYLRHHGPRKMYGWLPNQVQDVYRKRRDKQRTPGA